MFEYYSVFFTQQARPGRALVTDHDVEEEGWVSVRINTICFHSLITPVSLQTHIISDPSYCG